MPQEASRTLSWQENPRPSSWHHKLLHAGPSQTSALPALGSLPHPLWKICPGHSLGTVVMPRPIQGAAHEDFPIWSRELGLCILLSVGSTRWGWSMLRVHGMVDGLVLEDESSGASQCIPRWVALVCAHSTKSDESATCCMSGQAAAIGVVKMSFPTPTPSKSLEAPLASTVLGSDAPSCQAPHSTLWRSMSSGMDSLNLPSPRKSPVT